MNCRKTAASDEIGRVVTGLVAVEPSDFAGRRSDSSRPCD